MTEGWGYTKEEKDSPAKPLCKIHYEEYKIKKQKERDERLQKLFEAPLEGRKLKPVKVIENYRIPVGHMNSLVNNIAWTHTEIKEDLQDINRIRRLLQVTEREKTILITDISCFTNETKITFLSRYPGNNPWFLIAREIWWLKKQDKISQAPIILEYADDKYKDYLSSEEWQKKRDTVLERDNYACRICDCGDELHVHHKTYDNIYEEPLGDLITLCKSCHELFHRKGE